MVGDPKLWERGLPSEADFWEQWLSSDEYAGERQRRIQMHQRKEQFDPQLLELLHKKVGDTIRVLDVGSGPISCLTPYSSSNKIELVCTDVLAHTYNEMLQRHGILGLPRVEEVKAEELRSVFGEQWFDVVHCSNALDHCANPLIAFIEMYRVCRNNGILVLWSFENEGKQSGYDGLHQWNLEPAENGVRLWNESTDINLLDHVNFQDFVCEYTETFAKGYTGFSVRLRVIH